ncbi:MAG: UDP-N-acetylmuramate dehydrogenase [Bacteriovoracaceae bacterium]
MKLIEQLSDTLSTHPDLDFKTDIDLTRYSTFKMKATGNLIQVKSLDGLIYAIKNLNQLGCTYRVIGWGANLVLEENPIDILIKLDFEWNSEDFSKPHDEYDLWASTPLNVLTSHAHKFGLKGWEVFTGIPASLGGAIFMNAGTNLGEIGNIVKEVTLLTKLGELKVVPIGPNSFSYRENHFVGPGDIIVKAKLKHLGIDSTIPELIKNYLSMRNSTQPLSEKTCGCVFKNFSKDHRAGQMIDLMGFKGLSYNGLRVSHKHANFMENKEEASASDFHFLSRFIISELKLSLGIEFELEVKID